MRGFGDVGYSGDGIDAGLPGFGSHDGGMILHAGINHYKGNIAELKWDLAETEVLVEMSKSKLDYSSCIVVCPKASHRPSYKGVRPRAYRREPTD